MRRDRLPVVLRLRELREQEATVARAAARRRAADAAARTSMAAFARDRAGVPAGTAADAAGLEAARLQGLALDDEVRRAAEQQVTADRAADRAEDVRVGAAVARRSVERLQERRTAEHTEAAAKVAARRDDDVALQVWRRSR